MKGNERERKGRNKSNLHKRHHRPWRDLGVSEAFKIKRTATIQSSFVLTCDRRTQKRTEAKVLTCDGRTQKQIEAKENT